MEASGPRPAREAAWLLFAAVLCLVPRLWFAREYPTVPYSDFNNLLNFAIALNEPGWEATKHFWQYFGVGLPLALSVVLRLVPGPPAEVARYATAVLTGLAAIAPFVIWKEVFRLRTRMASAILLGLWPAHVFFSGVVAQDNWILPPSVALAALAVRSLNRKEAWPLTSALLFCAAGAIRPEMFVALLPPALAAAGAFRRGVPRTRGIAIWAATATACVLTLAGVRWAGSGRFSVGPEHLGMALLGAATPGAGATYWNFPQAHFAAYAPELEGDREEMKARSMAFAIRELAHRPVFHVVRMFSAGVNSVLRTDSGSLMLALGVPQALPPAHKARGAALVGRVVRVLDQSAGIVMGLFFGALFFGVGPRASMLVLAAAILLKVGVHAATVAQPRYFVVALALALMGLTLAAFESGPAVSARRRMGAVALGLALAYAGGFLDRKAQAYVLEHDEQLTYRFTVWDGVGPPRLRCTMSRGLLSYGPRDMPSIRPFHADPAPGEEAIAECLLEGGNAATPVALEVLDSYPRSGYPGRIVQVVTVDGSDVLRHDIAADAGEGWNAAPLQAPDGRPASRVDVRVQAGKTEPGWHWGVAGSAVLRLVPITPPPSPGP